jgi:hypothetical protein
MLLVREGSGGAQGFPQRILQRSFTRPLDTRRLQLAGLFPSVLFLVFLFAIVGSPGPLRLGLSESSLGPTFPIYEVQAEGAEGVLFGQGEGDDILA